METIGRYRIAGELGRGAMGIVYRAIDPSIGRTVAIKTIRIRDINDTRQRDKLRERLFREARSAGVLSHPNIVTIYDMDEVDGLAYIAMAYINGPTLENILTSGKPLSGTAMLKILRQTASALDYAHSRGVIHRDIKPANIMTDEDGAVKITDFGIARITTASNMTETRTVVGTPNYMSPEQVQGLAINGRSDQFSLAVIAYEILTGERPFTGEHLSTVVYKIVAEQPAAAQLINNTLSARIDEVLKKGLSKKPEDRYPNCSNFVGALEMACAESRGWKTLPAGAHSAMPTEGVGKPAPVVPPPAPVVPKEVVPKEVAPKEVAPKEVAISQKRPSILVPALLSLMVVLAVAGVITWQSGLLNRSSEAQTPATPAPPAVTEPKTTEPAPSDSVAAKETPAAKEVPNDAPPVSDAPPITTAPDPKASPAPEAIRPDLVPGSFKKPSPLGNGGGGRLQDVWVNTNPPGAKAVLDDDLSQSCQTPCMIHAASGTHHLTFAQAGFENEYREVHVGDIAQDLPTVTLRKPGGTLMLTTDPPGATVRVNGQMVPQLTPAQITLAPGSYTITVEKGGKSQTQHVDIQQDPFYLRIPL
jgi:serine/threonine-protein kinase